MNQPKHYLEEELYQLVRTDPKIFNFIQESSLDGLWYWDAERPEEEWMSPRFWTTLGYDPAEKPHTLEAMQQSTFPDDFQCASEELERHLADPAYPFDQIMRYRHKNGSTVWIRCRGMALRNEEGVPLRVIGAHTDVTRLKEKEEELQSIIDQLNRTQEILEQTSAVAQVGGWEVDLVKDTVLWTQMTREIHEVAADFVPDLASGINFYKEGYSRDTIQRTVKQLIETGEPFNVELQLITAQKNEIWVRSIGRAAFKEGQCVRIYGTFQDISRQKIEEQMLKLAMVEAKAASVTKSEFLANMSHEIRTPLNSVIGFSDLLIKTELDENQRQYMHAVHHSANSLLDLINDILDFSKIEAGKLELLPEKCDLWEMLEQVSDVVQHKVKENNIELLLNVASDVPRYAWLDPIRIRQILINLLGNAAKFTEAGEIEIAVRLFPENSTKEFDNLEFSVRDTGIGIDPQRQQAVFKAFSQEDASTTRQYGGTGLGLTISNQLLGLMDSQMELESQVGKGSRFFFRINVKTEQHEPRLPEGSRNFSNMLIVDDHPKNLQIIQEMLALSKIASDTASNGLEALKMIENTTYDGLIIDYHMPYLNGIQVIREIRETLNLDETTLPVILLHSSADDHEINASRHTLGIQKVMTKPITLHQLTHALTSIGTPHSSASHPVAAPETATVSDHHINILLVDDNPMNRLLAQTMIRKILPNVTIREATDGHEAIDTFQEYGADMILMDIQMPRMSGYEASQQIRTLNPNGQATIIALTAGTVKGERERCLQAGMDDYISKPFVLDTLKEKFRYWLDQKASTTDQSATKKVATNGTPQHFNFRTCQETAGNDAAVIAELMRELFKELDEDLPLIKAAFRQQDTLKLKVLSHKHKASTAMVGLEILASLLRSLESQGSFCEVATGALVEQVEQEIEHVRALSQTLGEMPYLS